MDSPAESGKYFSALLSRINEHGIDAGIYEDIAFSFLYISERCPTPLLLSLLKSYVDYTKSPLYVNEIRNFLKENDKALYEAYGKSFVGVPGCQEVFGIELPDHPAVWPTVAPPPVPQDERATRSNVKSFSRQKKRRPKNIIKRQAKAASAAQHRQQVEKRTEKKRRRAEFEKLARRENGG